MPGGTSSSRTPSSPASPRGTDPWPTSRRASSTCWASRPSTPVWGSDVAEATAGADGTAGADTPDEVHDGAYDLVAMGRTGVDIYPLQLGVGLEDVETFQKSLGGTATNVAVAAARHGRDVALVTRTGADAFGRYIHRALRGFGVDDRFVAPVDGPPT